MIRGGPPSIWRTRPFLAAASLLTTSPIPPGSVPAINAATVRITLQRSACYGSCPDYRVTVDGQGHVLFTTAVPPVDEIADLHRQYAPINGIVVDGTHRARIAPGRVATLVAGLRAIRFWRLKPEYRAGITDNPTYIVTVDTEHGRKSVLDYAGLQVGMPQGEADLEGAIDAAAGTDRWIEGTAAVIPLLQAEKVNFAGRLGARLMNAAAARDDVATMRRLRQLGAVANKTRYGDPLIAAALHGATDATRYLIAGGAARDWPSVREAMSAAVGQNDGTTFGVLQTSGGRATLDRATATRLLPAAASNGNLALTTLLLRAGADVRGPEDRRRYDEPPIFGAANGTSAAGHKSPPAERRAVVALLLRRGSNIRQCALSCSSVLASVDDPVIARLLIRAGADPNFRDREGEPLIFSIDDEAVALELIRARARLDAVRPADGMTVRGWATYQKWPRVLALLAANGR